MPVVADAGQSDLPDPAEVLGWVGSAAPGLWFLSDLPADRREGARTVVWELCRSGQLEVGDWVPGRGQGFRRTGRGQTADPLTDPDSVRRPLLSPHPSVVTPLLMVVHVLWFVAGWVTAARTQAVSDYLRGTNHPIIHPIQIRIGGVSAPSLLAGEWWRLLTCGFVHIGLFHLLANMVILALLGTLAEAVWGRRRFLVLYLSAGLTGGVTAMAIGPLGPGGVADVYGTASGALWGVTAAVLAWMVRNLQVAPPQAVADCLRRVVVVAVMNLVVGFAQGVHAGGQVGGAVGGLAVAWCLARLGQGRWESRWALTGLVLTAAGFAGLLSAAVYLHHDWQTLRQRAAPPVAVRPAAAADRPTSAP